LSTRSHLSPLIEISSSTEALHRFLCASWEEAREGLCLFHPPKPYFRVFFVSLFQYFSSSFFRWFPYQIYNAIFYTTTSSACILYLRSTLLATVSFPATWCDSHALALENRSGFFQPRSIFHCQPLPPTRHCLTSPSSPMLRSLLFTRTWALHTSPPLLTIAFWFCVLSMLLFFFPQWCCFVGFSLPVLH
jgi:hypothetical protein